MVPDIVNPYFSMLVEAVFAAAAVGRLVDRIEQPGGPPEPVVVPHEIVVRESSEGSGPQGREV